MAKLRIGVLYDYWWTQDEDRSGERPRRKRQSPDDDIQKIYETLKEVGHNRGAISANTSLIEGKMDKPVMNVLQLIAVTLLDHTMTFT